VDGGSACGVHEICWFWLLRPEGPGTPLVLRREARGMARPRRLAAYRQTQSSGKWVVVAGRENWKTASKTT
jgi:hypothetical protein